jgi:hypothetical protein
MGSNRSKDPFHPRSPTFSLAKCLEAVGMPSAKAEPLAGGLINYVWRVTDQNGQTSILKHAEGSSKYNESRKSSAERLVYEVRALQMPVLRTVSEKVPTVCVPGVKAFDRELYALLPCGFRRSAESFSLLKSMPLGTLSTLNGISISVLRHTAVVLSHSSITPATQEKKKMNHVHLPVIYQPVKMKPCMPLTCPVSRKRDCQKESLILYHLIS